MSLPDAAVFNTSPARPSSSSTHQKKRPHHSSPVPSYRGVAVDRTSSTAKRARWDVTSPIPSPPILSVPLPSSCQHQKPFAFATTAWQFQFGLDGSTSSVHQKKPKHPHFAFDGAVHHHQQHHHHHHHSSKRARSYHSHVGMSVPTADDFDAGEEGSSSPTTEYSIRNAMALDRLRRSTYDEGEVFVERMREWEQAQIPVARRGVTQAEDGGHHLHIHTGSSSASTTSSPSMSNSITSNSSSTMSSLSVSGSEAGSTGRKRSWSIVEDDEDDENAEVDAGYVGMGTADMEWEVVSPTIVARNKNNRGPAYQLFAPTTVPAKEDGSTIPIIEMEVTTTEDQDGDDEQEDDDDEEDDDELVFVLNNPSTKEKELGSAIPTVRQPTFTASAGTERMLEELSQVLAAGAGSLDNAEVKASEGIRPIDGGALWE
ncbi:hypothetical protein FRB97_002206 [Tulasnella sp. 331]|nr:hypothetical protein FRB97_002206 [Tulasnella sp. 331]